MRPCYNTPDWMGKLPAQHVAKLCRCLLMGCSFKSGVAMQGNMQNIPEGWNSTSPVCMTNSLHLWALFFIKDKSPSVHPWRMFSVHCLTFMSIPHLSGPVQAGIQIQTRTSPWMRSGVFPSLPPRATTMCVCGDASSGDSSAPITASACSPNPPTMAPKVDEHLSCFEFLSELAREKWDFIITFDNELIKHHFPST